jgi:hypothetical protein
MWVVVALSGCHCGSQCDSYYQGASSYLTRCLGSSAIGRAPIDRFDLWCHSLELAPGFKGDLAGCGAALSSASCGSTATSTPACMFQGTLAEGTACGSDGQCQSGFCKGAGIHEEVSSGSSGLMVKTTVSCGVCTALIDVGQSCASGSRCVANAECSGGMCRALASSGEACASAGPHCASGLRCDSTGHCAERGAQGAACMSASDCTTGLRCVSGACATGGDVGATCDDNLTGMQPCKLGLICDASKTCKAVTYVEAGAACDGRATLCTTGFCPASFGPVPDGGTSLCPAVIADGQACDPNGVSSVCQDYAYCTGGTCQVFDVSACK